MLRQSRYVLWALLTSLALGFACGDSGEQSLDDQFEAALGAVFGEIATLAAAEAVSATLCGLIDENPNYTSNTIFARATKQAFASRIRDAYMRSEFLREWVQGSDYWSESGDSVSPEMTITQSGNSCQTNVGFVNAVCYSSGVQYNAGGSYKASEAPNSGGCSEEKR